MKRFHSIFLMCNILCNNILMQRSDLKQLLFYLMKFLSLPLPPTLSIQSFPNSIGSCSTDKFHYLYYLINMYRAMPIKFMPFTLGSAWQTRNNCLTTHFHFCSFLSLPFDHWLLTNADGASDWLSASEAR